MTTLMGGLHLFVITFFIMIDSNAKFVDSGDLGDNPWVIWCNNDGSYYIEWTDDGDILPCLFGPDPA